MKYIIYWYLDPVDFFTSYEDAKKAANELTGIVNICTVSKNGKVLKRETLVKY